MTWRQRWKPRDVDELFPTHKPEVRPWSELAPRQERWVDLERALGHDSARRIVEAAATLAAEPMPEKPVCAKRLRDAYFHPGGYAGGCDSAGERDAEWRRAVLGREPEPWEQSSPDPNVRLDLWVARELDRAGLPHWLHDVVLQMALVTMRDGVDEAHGVLLEERQVPEDYHAAIDGILKQIPALI